MTIPPSSTITQHKETISAEHAGSRLDAVAATMFPEYSRSRLKDWIKSGALRIDGRTVKPNTKLAGGEHLELDAELEQDASFEPEDIALDIVYEDDEIIVLNKPVGLVVHPAAGNWSGTLLNGLLFHCPELANIPRAGIVHRLDKDTSGLMVVAKTLNAQLSLIDQLQQRSVSRTYWAIVRGEPDKKGIIDAPIGRHPTQRVKMAVVKGTGKEARTHYRVTHKLSGFALVELKLETGRTHQIRVHMSHLGFPLVGDQVYGSRWPANLKNDEMLDYVREFPRQALHAKELGLIHPGTGKEMSWQTMLPEDFESVLLDLKDRHSAY
ncbi:23S rRNA pseudouridine(1911/1915/1917) synthase RluD [Agaribacterium sp. ZY112]|uniref:23S rRNA pseudouridine(1911/1915/1917) synthase RluD n=1 Tax=Agaribacterium sp. ZY112 TaxID=3233574 RepID=UPI0035261104